MSSRIYTVAAADSGRSVLDWLRSRLGISRETALRHLRSRQIRVAGTPCSNPDWRLRAGQRVEVPADRKEEERKRGNRDRPAKQRTSPIHIRHADEDIVVVEKPAGLTTMRHAEEAAEFGRGRRFLPDTLADRLPALLSQHLGKPAGQVRAVHRLDKDTTGLVVFARTAEAERHLGQQLRQHTVQRLYLALVRGKARDARIESWLVSDRGDGRRGSGEAGTGQHAVTHVRVVEELGEFSLVECRLETGRTHQVRIHLGEAGTPLCGERIYDRPLHGKPLPDGSGMKRVALHAATLGLEHPRTGERMSWTSPLPGDMAELLARLRRQ